MIRTINIDADVQDIITELRILTKSKTDGAAIRYALDLSLPILRKIRHEKAEIHFLLRDGRYQHYSLIIP
jgi:hypothetical protein